MKQFGKTWHVLLSFWFLPFIGYLILASCSDSGSLTEFPHYTSGAASAGGTGRYFMGREIAMVMSHRYVEKLDRPEREQEERTDLLISLLPLENATVVADIGAGSGYFTLRLARLLPDARIAAVDIQEKMLALIKSRAVAENLANVDLVLASEWSSGLAPASADLILLVDSYHELAWPLEYMSDLSAALTPAGNIVVVEQRAEDSENTLVQAHKMNAAQIMQEMAAAGLTLKGSSDELPEQHFLWFGLADPAARPTD